MDYKLKRYATSSKKYVNLKINGRLFPSWVLANFKKYKLPPIITKEGDDPCKTDKEVKLELRKYQLFASKILDYKSIYRDLLLYHGMGSGKTASAINIYNMLYNYTPGWNVFILIKAALRDVPWMEDLKKFLAEDENEFRMANIVFIHYDSPFADKDFLEAVKKVDSSKKSLYIVDEVHNFIRNVYGNITSGEGRRAKNIYNYIQNDKRDNEGVRVVLISATPAINNPFELALLFNLLRPGTFPTSENKFNSLYITNAPYKTLNNKNKNMFQRRILGLVSYYVGAEANPGTFAKKNIKYSDVLMSKYQTDIYDHFEDVEKQMEKRQRFTGKKQSKSVYKSYTRQSCNFVFPQISQKINGVDRPRPNKFRLTEREAVATQEASKLKAEKGSETFLNVNAYVKTLNAYTKAFDDLLYDRNAKDLTKKYTIKDDLENFKKYDNFNDFVKGETKFSNLFKQMHESSAKMTNIMFNIMESPGPVLVYSNYVLMEGIEILEIYAKYFGFVQYERVSKKKGLSYAEFHGGIKDRRDRVKAMNLFNKAENKTGDLIKIMFVSPAGTEGLSLMNVRQVHITEPYWNEVRIQQMIGRAIRLCSHKNLPVEDRKVDVYRYRSVRKNNVWTADQLIEDIARSKASLIESFLSAVKEAAIDCELFKNHNSMVEEYQCFQFSEDAMFDKYIGPAFKKDPIDDMKIDNGSSSTDHIVVKIKAIKIIAVIKHPKGYSKPEQYWFYPQSGVVYDYDLKFPVGKVSFDENNIPNKLDNQTYIIDYVIPIPMISE